MVLPKSSDDGYTGGSPKDVSGDGRYQTGKRTTTQCSRNPLALPERGIDHADYLFMHGENIKIRNYAQNGNYSFQYCKNVEIRNAVINSKDAFWNTENVTVYDSEINGEYLGWHSKNLRLVNCKISGTQPLCYAHDLMMENCTMADDCDLAFEYSSVQATINSSIRSVKNPRTGSITAESYGEVILDENIKAPGNCQLRLWNERTCFSA